MPVIYFGLSIIVFFIVYNKVQKDVLHPVAILSFMWFFTAAVASLQWGVYQREWGISVHAMILIAGLCCFGCGLVKIRSRKYAILAASPISNTYCLITRIVFFICLFLVIYFFYQNGMSFNAISNVDGPDIKTEIAENMSGRSSLEAYIMNLFPFCALYSFFEMLYGEPGNKNIKFNIFVICVVVFYCSNMILSRGTLLYVLLGGLFIYNSKNKISIKMLVCSMISVCVILGVLMIFRLSSGSVIFLGVENIENPILASAYNYLAYSFENFNFIVERGSRYQIFSNVLQSGYKLIGIYDSEQVVSNDIIGVFNSLTWLAPFYDDLGLLGVIMYPSIIGLLLSIWYEKSLLDKSYVLLLAVLQKAIFIPFFGNYFFTSFSLMFPYLVTGLICYMSKKMYLRYNMPRIKFSNIRIKWR